MMHSRGLLLIAMLCPAVASAITLFPLQTMKLKKSEQVRLSTIACLTPHGVDAEQIDAQSLDADPGGYVYASVSCKPHGEFNSEPMRFIVDCKREKKQWSCADAELEITVTLATKEVRVRPGKVSAQVASDMVKKIGSSGYFGSQSLLKMLESPCTLRPGAASELIDVECTGGRITMSTWCATSDCPRVFAADRWLE